mmetsp:Transcript_48297/g.89554  ORF Transcript_48297/g.89554 Transcript_48297/m.89554 type:complete len:206 (-) Transcript_48297:353-970(-)
MIDEFLVQIDLGRQTEFDHDVFGIGKSIESLHELLLENIFDLFLLGASDVDFGFQDGAKSGLDDLLPNLELLVDDGLDAINVSGLNDRAHLGSKHVLTDGLLQKFIEPGDRLHELHAILLFRKAFVALDEGHDALLFPQVLARREALDLAIHGVFEENGSDDLFARKGRAGDHASAHLVHHVVHAFFACDEFIIGNSIGFESLGS